MGFRLMRFADARLGIGAGGVEVAQNDAAQTCGLPNDLFRFDFADAIGALRIERMGFSHGLALRVAVDGGGAGKYQMPDASFEHGGDEAARTFGVVMQIALWLGRGFFDQGVGRTMYGRDRFVFG